MNLTLPSSIEQDRTSCDFLIGRERRWDEQINGRKKSYNILDRISEILSKAIGDVREFCSINNVLKTPRENNFREKEFPKFACGE